MSTTRTVTVDGETYEVVINGDGPTYSVVVGGRTFEVEVPEAVAAPKRRGGGAGKKRRSGTVTSSIPGKVVTVEVNEGQRVEEGQVILILEAMKMQNEIQAPVSGTVTSVQCEEGEAIEANVPLVVIEPDPEEDEDDAS
jgi:biotin carboxyl carrier protein